MENFTINMEVSDEDWAKFCLNYDSKEDIENEVMRQLDQQHRKWWNGETVRLRYRNPPKKQFIEVKEVLPDGK